MSGELHEAITDAIIDQTWVMYDKFDCTSVAGFSLATDAILALPEMQAIKAILSCAMVVLGYDDDPIKQQAKIEHLREAVAAASSPVSDWVMGGPS